MNPRHTAYQILLKLEQEYSNSSQLLQQSLSDYPEQRDRNLITDLVLGTTRWRGRLKYLIQEFSKKPLRQLDIEILVILQLGIYQILFKKTAAHAAIHETVNLCKLAKRTSATSFVNGILRTIQRSSDDLPEPRSTDTAVKLADHWSHPEWLVRRWLARFGDEETARLLEFNMQVPPVYIRINPLVSTVDRTLEQLEEEGIRLTSTEYGAYVFRVLEGAPQLTRSFADGEFYIQDPATELLMNNLEVEPERTILEIAAAPGGKTVQLASRRKDRGILVSVDSERNRMKLWQRNMQRMKVQSAAGVMADARRLPFGEKFDQVIVDAPCSSLGVIRRHPEIKWWRNEKDLDSLSSLQLQILESCAKYVRDEGEIVYMVCSFEPEETVQVVQRFIDANQNFEQAAATYLFPHQHKTDGFFQARLKRRVPDGT